MGIKRALFWNVAVKWRKPLSKLTWEPITIKKKKKSCLATQAKKCLRSNSDLVKSPLDHKSPICSHRYFLRLQGYALAHNPPAEQGSYRYTSSPVLWIP